MNYKIVKSSLKVRIIEKHLNSMAKDGWKYVDMFTGKGIFFRCVFLVFER